ncbi:MAG: UDP-2,3-diacylglucosamine diphosphatase [Paludibacter sp.]|nr:UDP-2,3-diacylglucosamine diphosphatase [Paludibacter sp.]
MIYFISDAHLGSRVIKNPRAHEKKLVDWLESVRTDATTIYLLGDMFDFWFEYRTVVPKGFVRFLGKLAEMIDDGIEIHFFTGNHDIWTFGYLEEEIGLIVHRVPITVHHGNKSFFLAHGDGLCRHDKGLQIIRRIFHSRIAQKMFRLIPPQLGQEFGYNWAKRNRERIMHLENNYLGEEREDLVIFSKDYTKTHDVDFLIFGHRHILLDLQLKNRERVIILGDFAHIFSYGVFDGEEFRLEYADNRNTTQVRNENIIGF